MPARRDQASIGLRRKTMARGNEGKQRESTGRGGVRRGRKDVKCKASGKMRCKKDDIKVVVVDDGLERSDDTKEDTVQYTADDFISILVAVLIAMLTSIIMLSSLTSQEERDKQEREFAQAVPFYKVRDSDDIGGQLGQSLLIAIIVVSIVIVQTIILLVLVKCRCYRTLNVVLVVISILLLCIFSHYILLDLLHALPHPLQVDWPSVALFLFNFGMLGVWSMFSCSVPLMVRQAYLLFVGVLVPYLFNKTLPTWAVYTLLGVLALWDLVAVLCPYGPLRILINTIAERGDFHLLNPLVYSTTNNFTYTMAFTMDGTHPVAHPTHPTSHPTHPTSHPTHPISHSTHPTTLPTHPTSHPTQLTSHPTQPTSNPTHPISHSTQPISNNTHQTSNLTYPVSPLIHPIAHQTNPISQHISHPTHPTTHPTDPTLQLTHPSSQYTPRKTHTTTPTTHTTNQTYVAHPTSQPTHPTSQPTHPPSQPTHAISQPTHPTTHTTHPTSQPTHPKSQLTHPISQPTYPTTHTTHPTSQPTHPISQPTHPKSQPTHPISHPTQYSPHLTGSAQPVASKSPIQQPSRQVTHHSEHSNTKVVPIPLGGNPRERSERWSEPALHAKGAAGGLVSNVSSEVSGDGEKVEDGDKRAGPKLGMGDFVFYSLLVGQVSTAGEWTTTIACVLSIVVGLGVTWYILITLRKPLPALPISIILTILLYIIMNVMVEALVDKINTLQILI